MAAASTCSPSSYVNSVTIDFFVHDSLHTYRNMHQEFEIVSPFLAPRAVVVADDVEGNSAFKRVGGPVSS